MGDSSTLTRDVGRVVSLTLVAVAALNGVGSAVAAGIEHRELSPGLEEYIEFTNLWLATGLMSLTLSAAVASWSAAPLLGYSQNWQSPVLVLVGGAFLTQLPVRPEGGTPGGFVVGAMRTFAEYYGTAFAGGLIVGGASCLIVVLVCDHLSSTTT